MPARIRVLYITTSQRTGQWLAEAFADDSAVDVEMEESVGLAAGLARMREEAFDALLVTHDREQLDALSLLEGLRAGSSDEPIIVLGNQSEQEMTALFMEVGADAYACVNTTTTRTLICVVARAIERQALLRENRRLREAEQKRLRDEHHEARLLIQQQRSLITSLSQGCENSNGENSNGENSNGDKSSSDHSTTGQTNQAGPQESLCDHRDPNHSAIDNKTSVCTSSSLRDQLPRQLTNHYRELLRTYIIMGSGNLSTELTALGELLATASLSAQQIIEVHLLVLEELLQGLRSRSTRHVMNRADLLLLEVLAHLGENYRRLLHQRRHPPRQLILPGFDPDDLYHQQH